MDNCCCLLNQTPFFNLLIVATRLFFFSQALSDEQSHFNQDKMGGITSTHQLPHLQLNTLFHSPQIWFPTRFLANSRMSRMMVFLLSSFGSHIGNLKKEQIPKLRVHCASVHWVVYLTLVLKYPIFKSKLLKSFAGEGRQEGVCRSDVFRGSNLWHLKMKCV